MAATSSWMNAISPNIQQESANTGSLVEATDLRFANIMVPRCPAHSQLSIRRCLPLGQTGCDILRDLVDRRATLRTHFFESLKSERRLTLLREIFAQVQVWGNPIMGKRRTRRLLLTWLKQRVHQETGILRLAKIDATS
jgi:hypothetical protein